MTVEPHGQLPEEIWSTMQPILEFVSITATVSSRPKRATSPLPVTLKIQFTAGRSASWQQTLEDVCKAATNVRQQFSEVLSRDMPRLCPVIEPYVAPPMSSWHFGYWNSVCCSRQESA